MRALRIANLDMAFATAFAALVGGNFQMAFAILLGADDFILALVSALPAMVGLLMIPGSVLGERFVSYKKFVAVGGFLWRFWWVPVVALPLMPESWPRLEIFLGLVLFSAVSIFLVNATYNAWLSSLVPESHRGWYFSKRIALATVVAAGIGFPASLFLDAMKSQDKISGGDSNQLLGLSILFGIGVLLGFVSFYFYWLMPNTNRDSVQRHSLGDSLRSMAAPLEDRTFRRLTLFLVVFVLGQTIAGPFFFKYGLTVLKLDFLQFQLFIAFHATASLLSAKLWGYFSDKYGNKPVLFISGVLLALGPLSWVLTSPGNLAWNLTILSIGHIFAGLAWTGVQVGQGNIILAISRPEVRSQAIGLANSVIAVMSGVAPLIGGVLMQQLSSVMDDLSRYHLLFVVNSVLRLVAVFFLFGIVDPTSYQIRDFLRQLSGVRPRGVLAMRKLSNAPDPRQKQKAIRQIAETGMKMAETELAQLLNDPSPRVRREAAIALRSVGADEAVVALVNLINNTPHLVEEEMVETLGDIGDSSAAAPLISLLETPSSALRRASAKALGRLRDPAATFALMDAASHPDDAELRRASIQALRLIGDTECLPVIQAGLRDDYPSVRVAAAEAACDLHLQDCASTVREVLAEAPDETDSELAYSLSHIGDESDLSIILETATRLRSPVGRRRCLLAAARLYGVEAELYRLLMLDPVRRDQALIEMSKSKVVKGFRRALSLYHAGEHVESVQHLFARSGDSRLQLLAANPPKEGFLLAACIVSR